MSDNKQSVIIYGAGGHAKVILDILKQYPNYISGGFFCDSNKVGLANIETNIKKAKENKHKFIIGIGDNHIRKEKYRKIKKNEFEIISLIHPNAVIAENIIIDHGTVVMAGSIVNPGCKINENSIINTRASIDHDCKIGAHSHIGPGAILCGGVEVGEGTFIGAGATVIEGVKIGENVVIGAGAVVVNNIESHKKVFGVPAK